MATLLNPKTGKPDLTELKERLGLKGGQNSVEVVRQQIEDIATLMTIEKAKTKILEKTVQKVEIVVATSLIADKYDEEMVLNLQSAIEEGRKEMEIVSDRLAKFFEGVLTRMTPDEREAYVSLMTFPGSPGDAGE